MYRFLTDDVIYFLMSLCVMIRQKGGAADAVYTTADGRNPAYIP